jgi:hypothetical protein
MKIYLTIGLFILCLFLCLVAFGQIDKKNLIIRAKVEKIPDGSFDEDIDTAPEGRYHIITYEVVKVCTGIYEKPHIKIAHGVKSTKKLKIGDEIVIEVKPTTEYREMAKELLEDFGVERSEDYLADFSFVKFEPTNKCK